MMPVISCNLLWSGRNGHDNFEKHRTYKRIYEVITDNPTDDENVVGAAVVALGLGLGTPFPTDPLAIVTTFEVEQSEESPTIWLLTIGFDSQPKLPSAVDPNGTTQNPTSQYIDNPLLKPAEWRFTSIDTEEPLTEWRPVNADGSIDFTLPDPWVGDHEYKLGQYVKNAGNVYRCVAAGTSDDAPGATGPVGQNEVVDGDVVWDFWSSLADALSDPASALLVAIANSGGFPFDPPPMEVISKPMIQVTKNVPIISLEYILLMKNAVNKTTWRNIPPRCAKCLTIEAGSAFENGISFVKATWHIALDPETFDRRILDCGWGRRQTVRDSTAPGGARDEFVEFKDAFNQPYGSPCPMNGGGAKLPPGDPPVYLRGVPRQVKIVDFNTNLPF